MKVLILFALLVASAAVFVPRDTPVPLKDLVVEPEPYVEGRITNGQKASAGQFPYQAGLSAKIGTASSWCGGSLISNSYVLTVAHCTNGASQVTVYLGSTTRAATANSYTVSSANIIQHAGYKAATRTNDISLIKIPRVKFTNYINKIKLPPIGTANKYVGRVATASGWGRTSDTSYMSSLLNYANLTVITNSACSAVYGTSVVIASVICTATTATTSARSSTCQGDDGGPLALGGNTLIGITSFMPKGCASGDPAGFTRVTSYLSWIKTNSGVSY